MLLALALAGGCRFDESGMLFDGGTLFDAIDDDAPDFDGGATIDARLPDARLPDATPPADAYVCEPWLWNPTNFDPCDPALPAPAPELSLGLLGTYTLDSDSGSLTPPVGPSLLLPGAVLDQGDGLTVRVVVVSSLNVNIGSTLEVEGSLPVILAVYGQAAVGGVIDASARNPVIDLPIAGPGSDLLCNPATPGEPATDSDSGGGGGGGGGFGDKGGNGGDGQGSGKGAKGSGGTVSGNADISPLRGGCSGAAGGDANDGMAGIGGEPGTGGGAIQISARDSLTVSNRIRSAGVGGRSGGAGLTGGHAGGAGAGSGGAILLESDQVTIGAAAVLCANGGSGGEGASSTVPGAPGATGTCSDSDRATTVDSGDGGNGGAGGYAGGTSGANGTNGSNGGGGGGGGGGVGRIRVRGVTSRAIDGDATFSPDPTS